MAPAAELSPIAAAGLAVLYTLSLVLPFYASPTTRPRPGLDRNAAIVIRTRMRLVCSTCLVCCVATWCLLRYHLGFSTTDTLHLLGWWPVGFRESKRALALVAVLFAGPLFEKAYAEERAKRWVTGESLLDDLRSLRWWRNIVVGPLSEELLFRSLLVPLYLLSSCSTSSSPSLFSTTSSSLSSSLPLTCPLPHRIVLWSPLPFALAHLHHLHESRLTHPEVPLVAHVAVTVLQFSYTALFGWFAAFLFARSGSLLACVLCHAFANWMGLPRVWGRVRKIELWGDGFAIVRVLDSEDEDEGAVEAEDEGKSNAESRAEGDAKLGDGDGEEDAAVRQRPAAHGGDAAPAQKPIRFASPWENKTWDAQTVFCTAMYYTLLPLGAVGFYRMLWRWTEGQEGMGLVEGW